MAGEGEESKAEVRLSSATLQLFGKLRGIHSINLDDEPVTVASKVRNRRAPTTCEWDGTRSNNTPQARALFLGIPPLHSMTRHVFVPLICARVGFVCVGVVPCVMPPVLAPRRRFAVWCFGGLLPQVPHPSNRHRHRRGGEGVRCLLCCSPIGRAATAPVQCRPEQVWRCGRAAWARGRGVRGTNGGRTCGADASTQPHFKDGARRF